MLRISQGRREKVKARKEKTVRRNKVKSDLKLFELLSSKGYALGTDFIVGHPGETDTFWNDAMKNLFNIASEQIHVVRNLARYY